MHPHEETAHPTLLDDAAERFLGRCRRDVERQALGQLLEGPPRTGYLRSRDDPLLDKSVELGRQRRRCIVVAVLTEEFAMPLAELDEARHSLGGEMSPADLLGDLITELAVELGERIGLDRSRVDERAVEVEDDHPSPDRMRHGAVATQSPSEPSTAAWASSMSCSSP